MITRILFFIYELPQNLLGILNLLIVVLTSKLKQIYFERERIFIEIDYPGGISLGLFVFYTVLDNRFVSVGNENKNHEFGHSIQSRILGPLYLPTVGLISMLRVIYSILFKVIKAKRWNGYYSGFPEGWADRLGGVKRESKF